MKKIAGLVTTIVLSIIILLTGCGNSSTGKASNQDNGSIESDTSDSVSDDENMSGSALVDESSPSCNTDEGNSSSDPDSSSSVDGPSGSSSSGNAGKPSNAGGSSNSGGNNNSSKPSAPPSGGNSGSNQPIEPEKPAGHIHNWVKEPKGLTFDWQGVGPDENGNTTNREKTKVSINMCATCYEYFGVGDISFDRYWEHADKTGHGGYSTYPVYAVYDVYFCEECASYKRGGFSFYGYYDYSESNPKWKYLTPEQIAELNLP